MHHRFSLRPIMIGLIFVLVAAACAQPGEPSSRTASPESASTTTRPGANLADVDFGLSDDTPESFAGSFAAGLTSIGGSSRGFSDDQLAAASAGRAVNSFLALVDDIEDSSYSVGYEVAGADAATGGGLPAEFALAIVHTPDRHKLSVSAGPDATFEQIITPGGTANCTRLVEWECESVPTPPADEILGAQQFLYVLALITETPGAFDIREYTSSVVGVPVRCTEGRAVGDGARGALGGDIGVCITGEGIPLSVKGPGFELEGVWYKPSADAGEFSAPAAIT